MLLHLLKVENQGFENISMEKKFRLMEMMVKFPERKQELLLFQQPKLAVSDLPMPQYLQKGHTGNKCLTLNPMRGNKAHSESCTDGKLEPEELQLSAVKHYPCFPVWGVSPGDDTNVSSKPED